MITYNSIATKEDKLFHTKIKRALFKYLGVDRGMAKYNQLVTVAKIEFNAALVEVDEVKRNNHARRQANLVFVRELKKLGIKLETENKKKN